MCEVHGVRPGKIILVLLVVFGAFLQNSKEKKVREAAKRVRNEILGASLPGIGGPQKSKIESKTSHDRLFLNYFDSFSTPFWTFGVPGGAERPRSEVIQEPLPLKPGILVKNRSFQ